MIADWQTNKIYLLGKLSADFPKISKLIESKLIDLGYKPEILPNTNDIWARDYMPIQIAKEKYPAEQLRNTIIPNRL